MKKVNVRELHARTGAIVSEAAEGEVIIIEKRGKPVAELRRHVPKRRKTIGEIFREREKSGFWDQFPSLKGDSTKFISEDRDRG